MVACLALCVYVHADVWGFVDKKDIDDGCGGGDEQESIFNLIAQKAHKSNWPVI